MKKQVTLLIILSLAAACGSESGSNNDFPDVAGNYALTNTDCDGGFDDEVVVIQNDSQIIVQATSPGFTDISGTLDADGNFEASNSDIDCEGVFVGDVLNASCDACSATYELARL